MSSSPDFAAESTRDGTLPPWELAKAYAFSVVIDQMVEMMEETASVLLGMGKNEFICSKVHVKNGGNPTPRALQKALASCRDPTWYPGKRQCVGRAYLLYREHCTVLPIIRYALRSANLESVLGPFSIIPLKRY